jgi:hypothetical protein
MLSISVAVIAATTIFLKFNWYDRMRDWPDALSERSAAAAARAA